MVDPRKWRKDWELAEEGAEGLETGLTELKRKPKKRISKGRIRSSTRRAKRKTQRVLKRYKRVPKIAKRKIEIISRKGQPQVTTEITVTSGGVVSSSWIWKIVWTEENLCLMELNNGYVYIVPIPYRLFEEWGYAHSKGTFFNQKIKKQYKKKIKRIK